jgi:hypothetical protein
MQAQHTTADLKGKAIVSPILADSRKRQLSNFDAKIRRTLDDSIRRSGGRPQIRVRMCGLTGHSISINMLNQWLAPGRELARFPVLYVDAFCEATGDDTLKRLILGPELRQKLELGERAAAILDQRAQHILLRVGMQTQTEEERNGNGSCER